jgi:uncharacterized repeat protein (TIGR03803 family)
MTTLRTLERFTLWQAQGQKEASMARSKGWRTACALLLFCAATAMVSPAQTFKTLLDFDFSNGGNPQYMSMVQGTDGGLYGMTLTGGGHSAGSVFKITQSGALTTIYSFCSVSSCTDGYSPYDGLVQGTDGSFYGTTSAGGNPGPGTVFKVTSKGVLTTLYNFCSQTGCPDGELPYAGLVQASDGNFYGTTIYGGTNNGGTIFKITPQGVLKTLYRFCAQTNCPDGKLPWGGLVQASDGNLYGTTYIGGANSAGTVFRITTGGTLKTLHSFNNTDGTQPTAALIQATDGNLYGTTIFGGSFGIGTVFKISLAGKLTTVNSFNGTDGTAPFDALVQATDGNFYGTTDEGGTAEGNIFKITPGGTITSLYSFCSKTGCPDGNLPLSGLVQATNGTLYGTTQFGGSSTNCAMNCGTIFSLGVGLGPFIETRPTSGKVGAKVIILGNNLTGAKSVTFNGTAAKFKVVSSSEITTTVPTGAATGKVKVVTPRRRLTSNVNFRVLK